MPTSENSTASDEPPGHSDALNAGERARQLLLRSGRCIYAVRLTDGRTGAPIWPRISHPRRSDRACMRAIASTIKWTRPFATCKIYIHVQTRRRRDRRDIRGRRTRARVTQDHDSRGLTPSRSSCSFLFPVALVLSLFLPCSSVALRDVQFPIR